MTQEALKLALGQLQAGFPGNAMQILREALAQTQEPVAWWNDTGTHIDLNVSGRGTPLYTTPPQRTWVGLTDEERQDIALEVPIDAVFITEAKLKEKNT